MAKIQQMIISLFLVTMLTSAVQAQFESTAFLDYMRGAQLNPNTTIDQLIQPFWTLTQASLSALKLRDLGQFSGSVPQPPPQNISSNGSSVTTRDVFLAKKAVEIQQLDVAKANCAKSEELARSLNFSDDPANLERLPYNNIGVCLANYAVVFGANPLLPAFSLYFAPPTTFSDGTKFDGSMQATPAPDSVYRSQIVTGLISYEIKMKINPSNPLVDLLVSIQDSSLHVQSLLTLDNITTDSEGNFVITVDRSPANGRPNHLQSSLSSIYIQIRDIPKVGPGQDPNSALSQNQINVVTSCSTSTVLTYGIALLKGLYVLPQNFTMQTISDYLNQYQVFSNQVYALTNIQLPIQWTVQKLQEDLLVTKPYNQFSGPSVFNTLGYFATEAYSGAKCNLTDTQALVVTVAMDDAKYMNANSGNELMFTDGIYQQQVSLNNLQAQANQNGTYTFIFAKNDPGYYNWIETTGLNRFYAQVKWVMATNPQLVSTFVTEISQLPQVIFDQSKLSGTERIAQLAEYRKQYSWKYLGY